MEGDTGFVQGHSSGMQQCISITKLVQGAFAPANDFLQQQNGRDPEERPPSESHCLQKRCLKEPAWEMSVSPLLSTHPWTCTGATCKRAFSIL